jgi:hypothetical protein
MFNWSSIPWPTAFLSPGIKRPVLEAECSIPSNADAENVWSFDLRYVSRSSAFKHRHSYFALCSA